MPRSIVMEHIFNPMTRLFFGIFSNSTQLIACSQCLCLCHTTNPECASWTDGCKATNRGRKKKHGFRGVAANHIPKDKDHPAKTQWTFFPNGLRCALSWTLMVAPGPSKVPWANFVAWDLHPNGLVGTALRSGWRGWRKLTSLPA